MNRLTALAAAFFFAGLAIWGVNGVISSPAWAAGDNKDLQRWPGQYVQALGQPVYRATVYLDAGWPHDSAAADAGLTAYTFSGGEHVCVQSSIDFCFEAGVAAAAMTAACGKAVTVPANQERCFFLRAGVTTISVDTLSGTGRVQFHETRL